ncbi:MAG: hypothetical protein FJ403_19850 [Verrucomicrobia bacterium]|nr:hypothetical protein [Verrucomicrobiota bacterium]
MKKLKLASFCLLTFVSGYYVGFTFVLHAQQNNPPPPPPNNTRLGPPRSGLPNGPQEPGEFPPGPPGAVPVPPGDVVFNAGGPPGPGRGGFGPMQQERKVLKQFDKDGNGRLNLEERAAARDFLKKNLDQGPGPGRGFRGRGGGPGFPNQGQTPPQPGRKVSPTDVKSLPNAPFYDANTLRTFFLEFESSDWDKELTDFRNTDVEVPAKLTVDGKTCQDVGIHVRGMSSSGVGEGRKRSLNLALDFAHADQQIGGYRTLNLLNAHEDPTFLRTVLYHYIAREYIPAPKANFVHVVINGESWGIYVNTQQFNKDFIKEWFGTTKGARWKVPGSPGGQGNLGYLGDDIEPYKRAYEIKTKDDKKSWADLIKLCKVLNETPASQLQEALAPLLDIDGALKFLALENALINNDGYWIRTSDYSLYQDEKGRFHVFPHDANETFARPGGPGFMGALRFGVMNLAQPFLSDADKNGDKALTKDEFAAMVDIWFDKLDSDKAGSINQQQFVARIQNILPVPQRDMGPQRGGPPGAPPGFGPSMSIGPALFASLDSDQNGSLTRGDLQTTFTRWFTQWDAEKSGSLTEEELRNGFSAVIPQPTFGGPGGPPGGPNVFVGRGGGPGGRGGRGGRGGPGGGDMPRVEGVKLDPLIAAKQDNKPLISKLLAAPELRKRYLGYVRDIAEKWLDWNKLGPVAEQYHSLIAAEVRADTRKLESTEAFEKGLLEDVQGSGFGPGGGGKIGLKKFADERRAFLLQYKEGQSADAEAKPNGK